MRRVLVLNGPNLNLLGVREPDVYGSTTLSELDDLVTEWGADLGLDVETYQSNHEGALIDRLHRAREGADGVVINAGALTHYSYALHDAIVAAEVPTVEVHISNIHTRDEWRRRSVIAPACVHGIAGRGIDGYRDALAHLHWTWEWPPRTVRYGPDPDHVGDLRIPAGDGPWPVAVVIHGGFWRQVWTRDLMDGVAVALASSGWATWNIEYRRVGSGGGWPTTLEDVAAAVDALATMPDASRLDLERVVTIGHSAGGHLALWAAARTSLPPTAPGSVPQVHPVAAVGLAPVADLSAGHDHALGNDAVADLMGGTPSGVTDRYAAADPARLLPLGVRQLIIHGDADDVVPVDVSETYVGAAVDAGDAVVLHELTGADHLSLIDPRSDAWPAVEAELADLW